MKKKGQALVEFAIILPIVVLVFMGIMEFAIVLNSYLKIENASREGARVGIVGKSDIEIKNLITSTSPNLDPVKIVVSITPLEAQRKSGETLTVKVTYNYEMIVPIIRSLVGENIVLKAETSMRIE